ncbi:MAG: archease [Gemmatimonadota bacterium]|nr:archease [Gemmatimonadota bacterium]
MTAEICPGVSELDHTADVGISVRAASLRELFHRAALGMFHLVYADETGSASSPSPEGIERPIVVEGVDVAALLVRWLRELLYLDESEAARYVDATLDDIAETRLAGRVRTGSSPTPPVRELKGVTYHDLEVAREDGGWRARVVFDV